MKYCLVCDDDDHWYLCPFEYREEALVAIERAEDDEDLPSYLRRIDGPHRLSFENPTEE